MYLLYWLPLCVCVCFSYQSANDRVNELRNENDELRSAAVTADESYQKLLDDKGMLEVDLIRAKDHNSHLVQQVRRCRFIL